MRQRKITATITVLLSTRRPEDVDREAGYRKRDLVNWLNRHLKDIQNEMAQSDTVLVDVRMGYVDEAEEG